MKDYNNFDFLRLFLALSVVWHHFMFLTGQKADFLPFDIIDSETAVQSFFVISGALIWTSAKRTEKFAVFIRKRFFRVYPAYLLVLLVSSFAAIALYSANPLDIAQYLIWNGVFLNFMHPCIDDVFTSNMICAINGSLWTLKLEVGYYIFVAFCFYFLKNYSVKILICVTLLSISLNYLSIVVFPEYINPVLLHQLPWMFFYFGLGALLFSFYSKITIKTNTFLFLMSCMAYFLTDLFYPLFVITFVFYIAYGLPFRINLNRLGDLSYGVYLFHFPLIQYFVALELFSGYKYLDIATIFMVVSILAYLSWHFFEKPLLNFYRG
ncbi:acyltransferase family protein [Pseudoalteromonas atlantica]|uniref:acyltransferase family protein n=1 Tax=Pseudoalteromonas atlantica TaxID=288 RepID=UPI0037351046